GRVRLLRGDDAAARPLIAAVATGERHCADDAVAIDDGRPHVEIEPAVGGRTRCGERRLKLGVRRHIVAGSSSPGRRSQKHSGEHTYTSSDERSLIVHLSLLPPSGGVLSGSVSVVPLGNSSTRLPQTDSNAQEFYKVAHWLRQCYRVRRARST